MNQCERNRRGTEGEEEDGKKKEVLKRKRKGEGF